MILYHKQTGIFLANYFPFWHDILFDITNISFGLSSQIKNNIQPGGLPTIMKVLNGKLAAEDYMSSHTLTFSTPELTLIRFAGWLSDMIPDPRNSGQQIPRIMNFIEEKDFVPVSVIDDDKFVPTGAVKTMSDIYGSIKTETGLNVKFCSECGTKISTSARFCTECGANQD